MAIDANIPKIHVVDKSPYVKESDLTADWSIPLTKLMIVQSMKKGLTPFATLATGMNETVGGTQYREGGKAHKIPTIAAKNPLQYDAVGYKGGVRKGGGWPRYMKDLSDAAYRTPEVQSAVKEAKAHPDEHGKFYLKNEFTAQEYSLTQLENIKNGIDMIVELCGKLGWVGGLGRYRGKGQAARYTGRHVKSLMDMLEKDKAINKLISETHE